MSLVSQQFCFLNCKKVRLVLNPKLFLIYVNEESLYYTISVGVFKEVLTALKINKSKDDKVYIDNIKYLIEHYSIVQKLYKFGITIDVDTSICLNTPIQKIISHLADAKEIWNYFEKNIEKELKPQFFNSQIVYTLSKFSSLQSLEISFRYLFPFLDFSLILSQCEKAKHPILFVQSLLLKAMNFRPQSMIHNSDICFFQLVSILSVFPLAFVIVNNVQCCLHVLPRILYDIIGKSIPYFNQILFCDENTDFHSYMMFLDFEKDTVVFIIHPEYLSIEQKRVFDSFIDIFAESDSHTKIVVVSSHNYLPNEPQYSYDLRYKYPFENESDKSHHHFIENCRLFSSKSFSNIHLVYSSSNHRDCSGFISTKFPTITNKIIISRSNLTPIFHVDSILTVLPEELSFHIFFWEYLFHSIMFNYYFTFSGDLIINQFSCPILIIEFPFEIELDDNNNIPIPLSNSNIHEVTFGDLLLEHDLSPYSHCFVDSFAIYFTKEPQILDIMSCLSMKWFEKDLLTIQSHRVLLLLKQFILKFLHNVINSHRTTEFIAFSIIVLFLSSLFILCLPQECGFTDFILIHPKNIFDDPLFIIDRFVSTYSSEALMNHIMKVFSNPEQILRTVIPSIQIIPLDVQFNDQIDLLKVIGVVISDKKKYIDELELSKIYTLFLFNSPLFQFTKGDIFSLDESIVRTKMEKIPNYWVLHKSIHQYSPTNSFYNHRNTSLLFENNNLFNISQYVLTTFKVMKLLIMLFRAFCNIECFVYGESGCGKTTDINFLMSLFKLAGKNAGLIEIDSRYTIDGMKNKLELYKDSCIIFIDDTNMSPAFSFIHNISSNSNVPIIGMIKFNRIFSEQCLSNILNSYVSNSNILSLNNSFPHSTKFETRAKNDYRNCPTSMDHKIGFFENFDEIFLKHHLFLIIHKHQVFKCFEENELSQFFESFCEIVLYSFKWMRDKNFDSKMNHTNEIKNIVTLYTYNLGILSKDGLSFKEIQTSIIIMIVLCFFSNLFIPNNPFEKNHLLSSYQKEIIGYGKFFKLESMDFGHVFYKFLCNRYWNRLNYRPESFATPPLLYQLYAIEYIVETKQSLIIQIQKGTGSLVSSDLIKSVCNNIEVFTVYFENKSSIEVISESIINSFHYSKRRNIQFCLLLVDPFVENCNESSRLSYLNSIIKNGLQYGNKEDKRISIPIIIITSRKLDAYPLSRSMFISSEDYPIYKTNELLQTVICAKKEVTIQSNGLDVFFNEFVTQITQISIPDSGIHSIFSCENKQKDIGEGFSNCSGAFDNPHKEQIVSLICQEKFQNWLNSNDDLSIFCIVSDNSSAIEYFSFLNCLYSFSEFYVPTSLLHHSLSTIKVFFNLPSYIGSFPTVFPNKNVLNMVNSGFAFNSTDVLIEKLSHFSYQNDELKSSIFILNHMSTLIPMNCHQKALIFVDSREFDESNQLKISFKDMMVVNYTFLEILSLILVYFRNEVSQFLEEKYDIKSIGNEIENDLKLSYMRIDGLHCLSTVDFMFQKFFFFLNYNDSDSLSQLCSIVNFFKENSDSITKKLIMLLNQECFHCVITTQSSLKKRVSNVAEIINFSLIKNEKAFKKSIQKKSNKLVLLVSCGAYDYKIDQYLKYILNNSRHSFHFVIIIYSNSSFNSIQSTLQWPAFYVDDVNCKYLNNVSLLTSFYHNRTDIMVNNIDPLSPYFAPYFNMCFMNFFHEKGKELIDLFQKFQINVFIGVKHFDYFQNRFKNINGLHIVSLHSFVKNMVIILFKQKLGVSFQYFYRYIFESDLLLGMDDRSKLSVYVYVFRLLTNPKYYSIIFDLNNFIYTRDSNHNHSLDFIGGICEKIVTNVPESQIIDDIRFANKLISTLPLVYLYNSVLNQRCFLGLPIFFEPSMNIYNYADFMKMFRRYRWINGLNIHNIYMNVQNIEYDISLVPLSHFWYHFFLIKLLSSSNHAIECCDHKLGEILSASFLNTRLFGSYLANDSTFLVLSSLQKSISWQTIFSDLYNEVLSKFSPKSEDIPQWNVGLDANIIDVVKTLFWKTLPSDFFQNDMIIFLFSDNDECLLYQITYNFLHSSKHRDYWYSFLNFLLSPLNKRTDNVRRMYLNEILKNDNLNDGIQNAIVHIKNTVFIEPGSVPYITFGENSSIFSYYHQKKKSNVLLLWYVLVFIPYSQRKTFSAFLKHVPYLGFSELLSSLSNQRLTLDNDSGYINFLVYFSTVDQKSFLPRVIKLQNQVLCSIPNNQPISDVLNNYTNDFIRSHNTLVDFLPKKTTNRLSVLLYNQSFALTKILSTDILSSMFVKTEFDDNILLDSISQLSLPLVYLDPPLSSPTGFDNGDIKDFFSLINTHSDSVYEFVPRNKYSQAVFSYHIAKALGFDEAVLLDYESMNEFEFEEFMGYVKSNKIPDLAFEDFPSIYDLIQELTFFRKNR